MKHQTKSINKTFGLTKVHQITVYTKDTSSLLIPSFNFGELISLALCFNFLNLSLNLIGGV